MFVIRNKQYCKLSICNSGDSHLGVRAIGRGSTVAAYVASRREPLRVDELIAGDERFPEALGGLGTRLPDEFLTRVTRSSGVTPDTVPPTPTPSSNASSTSTTSTDSVGSTTASTTITRASLNLNVLGESVRAPQQAEKREVLSVLVYPITVDDKLVGVLEAFRFVGRLPFTIDHETVNACKLLCYIQQIANTVLIYSTAIYRNTSTLYSICKAGLQN